MADIKRKIAGDVVRLLNDVRNYNRWKKPHLKEKYVSEHARLHEKYRSKDYYMLFESELARIQLLKGVFLEL